MPIQEIIWFILIIFMCSFNNFFKAKILEFNKDSFLIELIKLNYSFSFSVLIFGYCSYKHISNNLLFFIIILLSIHGTQSLKILDYYGEKGSFFKNKYFSKIKEYLKLSYKGIIQCMPIYIIILIKISLHNDHNVLRFIPIPIISWIGIHEYFNIKYGVNNSTLYKKNMISSICGLIIGILLFFVVKE